MVHPLYVSTASTARHLYLRGGVGVGSMIKVYGGRQRNGVCPAHFSVGSRNVARKVLQALEGLKMVEKDPNGWGKERDTVVKTTLCCGDLKKCFTSVFIFFTCAYSGRRLTPQGQRDLDRIAGQVGIIFPVASVHIIWMFYGFRVEMSQKYIIPCAD